MPVLAPELVLVFEPVFVPVFVFEPELVELPDPVEVDELIPLPLAGEATAAVEPLVLPAPPPPPPQATIKPLAVTKTALPIHREGTLPRQ